MKQGKIYDRKLKRTIRVNRDTEYAVQELDEYGDIIDQRNYATLAEAKKDFNNTTGRVELERWRSVWNQENDSLIDRVTEVLMEK